MQDMTGRVVVVTGGGAGIGAATVEWLLAAGASVVSADRAHDAAGFEDANLVRVEVDVTSFADCEKMATAAVDAFGGIHALVASAGTDDSTTMHQGDPARWQAVLDTNLAGVAFSVRACMPDMVERGEGDVILLSSIAGRRPSPAQPIYSATKWGVVGMGNALRTEAATHGVRVTIMEPGMVDTQLARQSERGKELLQTVTPLAPADVARAIHFALTQPREVCVSELVLMSTNQP
jgi:NADP-dependent 3-hydroxy acid dehydrogenase YdfG